MIKKDQISSQIGRLPDVAFEHPVDPEATIEVLELSHLRVKVIPDHSIFCPHRIEFFLVIAIVEGTGRQWVDFESYPVEPGTVIQARPGQVQWYDPAYDFEALVMVFIPGQAAFRLPQPRWPTRLQLPKNDFVLLEAMMRTLHAVEDGVHYTSKERIRQFLLPPVLEILEGASQHVLDGGRGRRADVEAFDRLVEQHYARHRNLGWYAQRLGCSSRTLTRRCQQLTGFGAKQLLDQRVILEAKRRLSADNVRIEDLAHDLGFSEATNFVKFFRRRTGTTPAAFRRAYARLRQR